MRDDAKIGHEENSSCVKLKMEKTVMEMLLAAKLKSWLKNFVIKLNVRRTCKITLKKFCQKIVNLENFNEKILLILVLSII